MKKTADMIEEYLDKRLITRKPTRNLYKYTILDYFKNNNKDMNTYFSSKKKLDTYEKDIRNVYMQQEKERKPHYSRKTYFNVIKLFLSHHDKRIKTMEIWDNIKGQLRGCEPESDEKIVNKNDIKTIISHGGTLQRAIFLMLASSGRRIGEILALYPEDVDTTSTPASLNIKKTYDNTAPSKISQTTKTKQKTLCFISDEAKEAYLEWLKERGTYLRNASVRSYTHKKDLTDRRVFPMTYANTMVLWRNMLVKAGYLKRNEDTKEILNGKDVNTNRLLFHPHGLRKYFRGYFGDADLSEYLMGHSTMTTKTYRKMTMEDLAKKYIEHMRNVTFFTSLPDLTDIKEDLKEKDDEIAKMRADIEKMHNEILTLQNLETLARLLIKT
jgi:integrase